MAKVVRKSNFRVIVEPRRLGDYGSIRTSDSFLRKPEQIENDYQRRCDDIVDQIKRHVDEIGDVSVDFDTESTCSHCWREWEVDETGEPLCCDDAISEYKQSKETVK